MFCVCGKQVKQVLDVFKECVFVFVIIMKYLIDIEVDYGYEILEYSKEVKEIVIIYDICNGVWWWMMYCFEFGIFF